MAKKGRIVHGSIILGTPRPDHPKMTDPAFARAVKQKLDAKRATYAGLGRGRRKGTVIDDGEALAWMAAEAAMTGEGRPETLARRCIAAGRAIVFYSAEATRKRLAKKYAAQSSKKED